MTSIPAIPRTVRNTTIAPNPVSSRSITPISPTSTELSSITASSSMSPIAPTVTAASASTCSGLCTAISSMPSVIHPGPVPSITTHATAHAPESAIPSIEITTLRVAAIPAVAVPRPAAAVPTSPATRSSIPAITPAVITTERAPAVATIPVAVRPSTLSAPPTVSTLSASIAPVTSLSANLASHAPITSAGTRTTVPTVASLSSSMPFATLATRAERPAKFSAEAAIAAVAISTEGVAPIAALTGAACVPTAPSVTSLRPSVAAIASIATTAHNITTMTAVSGATPVASLAAVGTHTDTAIPSFSVSTRPSVPTAPGNSRLLIVRVVGRPTVVPIRMRLRAVLTEGIVGLIVFPAPRLLVRPAGQCSDAEEQQDEILERRLHRSLLQQVINEREIWKDTAAPSWRVALPKGTFVSAFGACQPVLAPSMNSRKDLSLKIYSAISMLTPIPSPMRAPSRKFSIAALGTSLDET
jgi:hypothetical protein